MGGFGMSSSAIHIIKENRKLQTNKRKSNRDRLIYFNNGVSKYTSYNFKPKEYTESELKQLKLQIRRKRLQESIKSTLISLAILGLIALGLLLWYDLI